MPVTVDLARCDGNGECVKACAFAAVEVRHGKAVIFENCTDCGACVLACPTNALWSDRFSKTGKAGILAIDFSPTSGIAGIIERAARVADVAVAWLLADPANAGTSADAIADEAKAGGYSLVALPHRGPGPAIAARVALRLDANLAAGCAELRLDEDGSVRAVRPRFGGTVKASARCARGITVATIFPRSTAMVSAAPLESAPSGRVASGEAPPAPIALARRLVVIGAEPDPDADRSARAFASAVGAIVVELDAIGQKPISPDLVVTIGVTGSTEINAALRSARVLVALVRDAGAPIAQVSDYLMVGDVAEHAKALLAAL